MADDMANPDQQAGSSSQVPRNLQVQIPNPQTIPYPYYEDELNLLDYWNVIYRYRRMIIWPTLVAAFVAGLYSITRPKMYLATATVVPPVDVLEKQADLSGGLRAQSMLRGVLNTGSIADLYVGILKSRAVMDAMIERFDLFHVYKDVKTWEDARKVLTENTKIEVGGKDGIVQVSVKDRDPNRAAAMANAYLEELDRQNKRLYGTQATSKRVFLENRLEEIRKELAQIDTLPAKEAQIKEMLFELLTREYELARLEEAKSMPTIQVLDKALPPEKRMARGTITKTMLAGMVMLMTTVFVAFGREYIQGLRTAQAGQAA
ncbi:MAG: Wzz/FepE/Etk N-terminal domain-containing protein [Sedimentisphaerales bacterium]|nr:Wzz/FepE/Etk N-terminal domain-containing protein [Sedimentisphaerales bacterium]